jgi:hypothetical protein
VIRSSPRITVDNVLCRTSAKLRFDRGLHGLQPDDNLHSENGRRDIVIEDHWRHGTDIQEVQLGQGLALQRWRGFLPILHVVDGERSGPSAAICAVDQDGAIEIILEKGKYLAVSSLAAHRTQEGLRNLFEHRKQT